MQPRDNHIVRSVLAHIGLTPSEIDVYQVSLSMGARPASTIAKAVGFQRSRTYDVLTHSRKSRPRTNNRTK